MKTKIFTFFLALAASAGTMLADKVQIGDFYYNLDDANMTAEVTCQYEYSSDNYSGLTTANVPSIVTYNNQNYSVTSIDCIAFAGCSSLNAVTIPNTVTIIKSHAFFGCYAITSVEAPVVFFDVIEDDWMYYTRILQNVRITGGKFNANALAFMNQSYKTLKTIDLTLAANTELEDEAFKGCYNLQTLILPPSLERISYMAVADCKNLQSIDIPASVVEIDQSAFENCRSLQIITFGGVQPSSVYGRNSANASTNSQLQRIGNWAFYNAHELQNLDIPEGVTEIGDGAFYGCTYLEDLILPSSVQSIGNNCFALCGKLQKIVVNSTIPPTIEAKTFYEVKRQIPVYVPDDCVNNYKNDPLWSEFDIHGVSEMPEAVEYASANHGKAHKVLCDGQIYILMPNGQKYSIIGELIK